MVYLYVLHVLGANLVQQADWRLLGLQLVAGELEKMSSMKDMGKTPKNSGWTGFLYVSPDGAQKKPA